MLHISFGRDSWLRWTDTGREWCCICRGMAPCRIGEIASRYRVMHVGIGSETTYRATRCTQCGFEQVIDPTERPGPGDTKDRALQIREPIRGIGRMLMLRFPSTKLQRSIRLGVITLGILLMGFAGAAHQSGCAGVLLVVVVLFLAVTVVIPLLGRRGKVLRLLSRALRPLSPSASELRAALSQESPQFPTLRGINPDELAAAIKKVRA